jgi:transposase
MSAERKRKGYTADFKRNAVKLVLDGRHTCRSVEKSLGVSPGIVYRWVRQYRASPQECFPGNGRLKATDERFRALERELQTVRMERDIL